MRLMAKNSRRFRPVLEGLEDRRVPAVLINELAINLPGGSDIPWEYAEMRGTPGMTLNNIYFVQFEGNIDIEDEFQRGKADFVQPLTGFQMGTNGLLIIKSPTGGHSIAPATTLVGNTLFDSGSSTLENGAATYMLIQSSTSIVQGTDYDANDDNVLELPVGAVVLDSVGWFENYTDEYVYTNVILDQAAGTPDAACRFNRANSTSVGAWYNGDLTGSINTLVFDPAELSPNFPVDGHLTPGDKNSDALPHVPPFTNPENPTVPPLPIEPPSLPNTQPAGAVETTEPTVAERHGDSSPAYRTSTQAAASADSVFADVLDIDW